jgi:hypothetical protein
MATCLPYTLFFFLVGLGLNSGLCAYKAGGILLEHTSSPFCSGYFGDGRMGLMNYLLGLALNHHPPDLRLPSK